MRWRPNGGRRGLLLSAVGLLAALAAGPPAARGDGEAPPGRPCQLFIKRFRGDPYYGRGGYLRTLETTGNPDCVSRFAKPSVTQNYDGYYVGGGCARKGGPPGPADGTYGWDYVSICGRPIRVVLNWCNRYQGGYGRYKIDGPPVVDVGPYISELRYAAPGHKESEKAEEHE